MPTTSALSPASAATILTLVMLFAPANIFADEAASNATLARYAAKFTECDINESFDGIPVAEITRCGKDPNRLEILERHKSGAIRFISKLSLDLDGGWKACNDPGQTDLCPTTYVYESWHERDASDKEEHWQEAFVSSDAVPYIVIPYVQYTEDRLIEDTDFRVLTGVSIGDVGVVIQNGLVVPVLVADGGPHNKIGEGSIALFERLGQSRCLEWIGANAEYCKRILNISLEGSVETYIFPGTKIENLTPDNINRLVSESALKLYQEMIVSRD